MIRWCDNGHPPSRVQSGRRCGACSRRREASRLDRYARGYGSDHQAARRAMVAMLPGPCGYCGRTVQPDDRWAASHVVDGQPEHGWMVAHGPCNERAKGRGPSETGDDRRAVPAPRLRKCAPGQKVWAETW